MNVPFRATSIVAPAAALAASLLLAGCSATHTDVQLRDAEDHSPIVSKSVGHKGPLHAGYHWASTDTDGLVHVRTKPDWTELEIVVAGAGHRIEASGVLHPHSDQWLALESAPNTSRRIEARIVSGEGAVPPPPSPTTSAPDTPSPN